MSTKTPDPKKTRAKNRRLRPFAWVTLGVCAASLIMGTLAWLVWSREATGLLSLFAFREVKTISKVLDRNGDVIGILADEHRVVIPYGDIPKAFVNALVATEDADFWAHEGTSSRAFIRAAWNFASSFGKRREGGSTLTMQLVRTVTAKRQRRMDRKLKEIILARKLEKAYTKKQILEMYANEVWFGGNRYGLEIAAEHYFGKSAPQLSVEECALLAGIIQNPGYLNPYSHDLRIRDLVKKRRDHVLYRMVSEGYLKEADAKILVERPIRLARPNAQMELVAPYVVEEVRKYLYEKYGKDTVLKGGIEVHTSIDAVWQQAANDAVCKGLKAVDRVRGFRKDRVRMVSDPELAQLAGWKRFLEAGDTVTGVILGWKNDHALVRVGENTLNVPKSAFEWAGNDVPKIFPRGAAPLFAVKHVDSAGRPMALELDQEPDVEGALLAVDPKSGEIRAMVGGYDFNRSMFNRCLQAERQVGSTMKAFVYAAAFAQGKTPATIVEDIPTRYTFSKPYEPRNYELDFWGPIPIWEAIRESRNVAAVRTLEATGIEQVVELSEKVGVTGFIPRYPSIALGSADLTLKDMVRGYATLANQGLQTPPLAMIRKIVDRNGQVLESHQGKPGEAVLDPMSNFQIVQCLQGVAQRGTGARSNALNWPVAGKTGTTDDHTDAWFVGFSTRIACGVWVGLDTKKTIYKKNGDGAHIALPIWVDFMKMALPTTPKEDFQAPAGMEWVDIDMITGLQSTAATDSRKSVRIAFKPGTAPKDPSLAEDIQKIVAAKEKARSQAVDIRVWGSLPPVAPTPQESDWTKIEMP